MSLPSDSETIYSDSEISSDESIHESNSDFIDDSDVESSDESCEESGNDFYLYTNSSLAFAGCEV